MEIKNSYATKTSSPPKPPIILTPYVAIGPATKTEVLWYIAQKIPELRKWIIANPSADAQILEYISQQGGPDVRYSFEVLFSAYDSNE